MQVCRACWLCWVGTNDNAVNSRMLYRMAVHRPLSQQMQTTIHN